MGIGGDPNEICQGERFMSSLLSSFDKRLEYLAILPRRSKRKLRLLLQGRLPCFRAAVSLVEEKSGIEIGGPTEIFQRLHAPSRIYGWHTPLPIYDCVASLDNCNFSSETMWATHDETYLFSFKRTPGKVIIADGSALESVADNSYDFVLSSHNLEHFANPVKALKEWKRITHPGGALILVLPYYRTTFDHRRAPTPVEHMFEDYFQNVGEDDMTHVSEVLRLHDLEMDGTLKTHTLEELRIRSTNNLSNRSLHHHVFDEFNSTELLKRVGLEILAVEVALPHHLVILSRWKD
jgi:SAM-dependent methyltransferase